MCHTLSSSSLHLLLPLDYKFLEARTSVICVFCILRVWKWDKVPSTESRLNKHCWNLIKTIFLGGGTGVWTQNTKQAIYFLSYTSSPFCSGYFGDGNFANYISGLALNCDLPISASQVARITGVSHWHLAKDSFSTGTYFAGMLSFKRYRQKWSWLWKNQLSFKKEGWL
jgi:hypothetical protein